MFFSCVFSNTLLLGTFYVFTVIVWGLYKDLVINAVTYVSRNVNWSVNKACSTCELENKVYKAKGQYNQYSPILTACTWGVFEWPEAECPVKMMQHKKYVNLTETAQTVEIHVEYSRSCRGRVVKTSDFYTGGPRLKSWLGSSTVGQGTLSSLPCLSENLISRRSIVYI